ncbi:hypothetical protein ACTFIZ_003074 [Dictyostelium cf. discoideum]
MFNFLFCTKVNDEKDLSKALELNNLQVVGNPRDIFNWRFFYKENDFSKAPKFGGIIHESQVLELKAKINRPLFQEIFFEKLLENAKLNKELEFYKGENQELKSQLSSIEKCYLRSKDLIINGYLNDNYNTTITASKTTIEATIINKNQSGGDSIDKSIEELDFFKIKSDQSPLQIQEEKQHQVNNIGDEIPQELLKTVKQQIPTETNEQPLSSTSPLHQKEEKQDKQKESKQEKEDKQEEDKQEEKEDKQEEGKQEEGKQEEGQQECKQEEEDKQEENKQKDDEQQEDKLPNGEEFIIEIPPENDTFEIIVDTHPRSSNDEVSIAVVEIEELQTSLSIETAFVTKQIEIPNKKLIVFKQSDFFPKMVTLLQSRLKGVTVQEVKDFSQFGLNDNSYGAGDFENVFVLYAVSCMGARTDSERDASKIKSIRSTIGNKVPIIYGVFMIGKNAPSRIQVEYTQASVSISHSTSDIGRNLQNNENLKQLQSFLQQK